MLSATRAASAPGGGLSTRRRWAALCVLVLPVVLVAVDNTVLAFAVPAISEALRPTGIQVLWMVDIYPLVLAGLLVPMGSLGDRIGRRRLLLIGASGFAAVSAAAAFAPSASWLVVARAAMGVFGSMLMPATLSLIRNVFVDARERRIAIAVWAAGMSGGAALGPLLGGFLLEHFGWPAVFWMAAPVLVPLLVLGPLLVPESRDPRPGPIDVVSIGLVLATMTPLVWGIKHLSSVGPDAAAAVALAVSVLGGVTFVRRQLRREIPMLDVRLFTNPVFSGSVFANLLSMFALVGFFYFAAQHLQLSSGMSPMLAGLFLLPGTVATAVAGLLVVRVVERVRPSRVVAGGIAINALGYVVVLATQGWWLDAGLMAAFILIGLGSGAAETISNDLILASVPAAKAGAASAISETAYEVGSVLGTAVLGSVLTAVYTTRVAVPDGLAPQDAAAAGQTLGGATDVAGRLDPARAEALLSSAREAFDSGVLYTSWIAVAVLTVAAVVALRALRTAS